MDWSSDYTRAARAREMETSLYCTSGSVRSVESNSRFTLRTGSIGNRETRYFSKSVPRLSFYPM